LERNTNKPTHGIVRARLCLFIRFFSECRDHPQQSKKTRTSEGPQENQQAVAEATNVPQKPRRKKLRPLMNLSEKKILECFVVRKNHLPRVLE
jgi:hypothetical protein